MNIAVGRRGLATTIDSSTARADRALAARAELFSVLGDPARACPLPSERFLIPGTRQKFGGGYLPALTSSALNDFKDLLIATRAREREIRADVGRAKWQSMLTWSGRALAWATLVPAVPTRAHQT